MPTTSNSQPPKKPAPVAPPSPRSAGGSVGGQCLCSPTTHQGSFRCRYHRSMSSAWLRRSNSMPSAASKSPSGATSASAADPGAQPAEAP
ncbi:hypothetical protein IEQ34_011980 [Dendrobium chrysotoxum]|uniref:Uncharacterized protein n=1 Tax=Dendrobium chrysotoxum TaxID=161865 RepID=A0AAV7GR87_DENCH|nr:hypothetical protein IEQ34_011980 [Dendrobium chrysotoxum]